MPDIGLCRISILLFPPSSYYTPGALFVWRVRTEWPRMESIPEER